MSAVGQDERITAAAKAMWDMSSPRATIGVYRWLAERALAAADAVEAREVEQEFDLGDTGNCLSCSKEREFVRGQSCLDCRIHYKFASSFDVAVYPFVLSSRRSESEAREVAALTAECEQLRAALDEALRALRNVKPALASDGWPERREAIERIDDVLAAASESVPAAQEEQP